MCLGKQRLGSRWGFGGLNALGGIEKPENALRKTNNKEAFGKENILNGSFFDVRGFKTKVDGYHG